MTNNEAARLIDLHKSLMSLTHSDSYLSLTRQEKLQRILEASANMLGVARISTWQLNDAGSSILCEQLYLTDSDEFQSGLELFAEDYPAYFAALKEDRLINADDAFTDPRTAEFTESYLRPLGIRAMLDAPIFAAGKLSGVLCAEHIGQPRSWTLTEMSCIAAVADCISTINEQELWIEARLRAEYDRQLDILTGLENRYFFQQRIDHDIKNDPLTPRVLIVVGIDNFKTINDNYGHDQADQVLQQLAMRFQCSVFPGLPGLSRISGDTFGFWMHVTAGRSQVEDMVYRIRLAMAEPLVTRQHNQITVSATIGVCSFPHDGISDLDPLRAAELAMQSTKKQQRGELGYFDTHFLQQLSHRQQLEREVRDAIQSGQLCAFYQPIIRHPGQWHGLEALVRWQHPERGLVPPGVFLPVVNDLGLMKELGQYMLRQACQDLSYLRQLGAGHLWVSVNLSPEQLHSFTLVSEIRQLLEEFDLPGHCLELEIVEEVIGQDSDFVLQQLRDLSALGISLSIDDFGTGYSSLSRLKHLPVKKLKIDKSFVDGLPHSSDDQSIARSIVGLAKAMNLQLVAEGVETEEQANWLHAEEVEFLQGYLFARPMCFDSISKTFH